MPLPVPVAPPVRLIQETLDAAVHEHPLCVVTLSVKLPPVAGALADEPPKLYEQFGDTVTPSVAV